MFFGGSVLALVEFMSHSEDIVIDAQQHATVTTDMEIVSFGSRSNLHRIAVVDRTLSVGSEAVHSIQVVSDPVGLLDSTLSTKPHVAKTAAICFHHMRRPRQLWRLVSSETTSHVVVLAFAYATVTTWSEFCNSILAAVDQ